MSYLRYGFEANMISIYGLEREKLQCNVPYCHFKYPKRFLEQMSMKGDMETYLTDVAILAGLFLVLRLLAYFALRIKLIQNR